MDMMSPWMHNSKVFEPDEETLKQWHGFVYCITNLSTGRMYIGKKFFWRTLTRPPLKGKKRKRKQLIESDWRKYCGSSNELIEAIEEEGQENFRREIIHLCRTKGECAYLEAREQFDRRVLQKPDEYYNGIINCRIHRRAVPPDLLP